MIAKILFLSNSMVVALRLRVGCVMLSGARSVAEGGDEA